VVDADGFFAFDVAEVHRVLRMRADVRESVEAVIDLRHGDFAAVDLHDLHLAGLVVLCLAGRNEVAHR
jgi:hypothetical protein